MTYENLQRPKLTGSEKWGQWANEIRERKLADLEQRRLRSVRNLEREEAAFAGPTPPLSALDQRESLREAIALCDEVAENLLQHADAKFWIDNRDVDFFAAAWRKLEQQKEERDEI